MGLGLVPWLVAGAALIGLAAWLLRLDASRQVNTALALFLFLRGLLAVAQGLFHEPLLLDHDWARALDSAAGQLMPALYLAVPLAAVHFALTYRSTYTRSELTRRLAWGALAVVPVLEAVYLVWPEAWSSGGSVGPLFVFAGLTYLLYALIALLFAWDYTRQEPGPVRRGFLLVSLGFAVLPLYVGLFELSVLDIARVPVGDVGSWFWVSHYLVDLALPVLVVYVTLLVLDARRAEDAHVGFEVTRLMVALGLPALTAGLGIGAFALGLRETGLDLLNGFEAVWEFALPLLVGYTLLRYQLFGLDVKLRFAIKQSTVAAGCGLVFLVASEVLEALLPIDDMLVGVASASLLSLVLSPLQRLAEHTASTVLPGVKPVSELTSREQRQLFRDQVEIALADGTLTEKDRRLLDLAAERLSIDQADADWMLRSVAELLGERETGSGEAVEPLAA